MDPPSSLTSPPSYLFTLIDPHHTIPHDTPPHHTIPHHTPPHHSTRHPSTPHHSAPHHSTPHPSTPLRTLWQMLLDRNTMGEAILRQVNEEQTRMTAQLQQWFADNEISAAERFDKLEKVLPVLANMPLLYYPSLPVHTTYQTRSYNTILGIKLYNILYNIF